ncbi:hypothetical protein CASFOL_005812 [Castilleja foliolosa]|uniref:RRM domain-containing protein n=1 Tax=Castilleja foliolosa TaxID=1961234 RepID=A0ABD3E5J6_9LAMI
MSRLRADAEPFVPDTIRAQQVPFDSTLREERSLFMTFSKNRAPLTWQEIRQHFTNLYGGCVDYVYMKNDQPNLEAEFGRIIFTSVEMINVIMGNNEKVTVWVGDKPICLKRYEPLYRRNNDQ